uniref:Uncharacterized protein n=1 Tax=Arundo donax TaxID=35708 RepID=A0A0A8YR85_ARUDO
MKGPRGTEKNKCYRGERVLMKNLIGVVDSSVLMNV